MFEPHLNDQQVYCLLRCVHYITGATVCILLGSLTLSFKVTSFKYMCMAVCHFHLIRNWSPGGNKTMNPTRQTTMASCKTAAYNATSFPCAVKLTLIFGLHLQIPAYYSLYHIKHAKTLLVGSLLCNTWKTQRLIWIATKYDKPYWYDPLAK